MHVRQAVALLQVAQLREVGQAVQAPDVASKKNPELHVRQAVALLQVAQLREVGQAVQAPDVAST